MNSYNTTGTQQPEPPNTLPKYLAEGLPKQDRETLEDVREYVDALIDYRNQLAEQPIREDELPEDTEVVDEGPKGTIAIEFRTCGDESCHCMSGGEKHGPYKYRVYREGETVKKEYIGKAERD